MKLLPSLLFLILLLGVTISTGCSQPATPPPTPLPTTIIPQTTPTPPQTTMISPTTTSVSLTPGPTVTVPPQYETVISYKVNTVARTITVQYNGGRAGVLLQRIDITLTTPAKEILTREMVRQTGSIPAGSEVTIKTIKGTHRLEVVVIINGVDYKVLDELVGI